jgi:hypothetical protein
MAFYYGPLNKTIYTQELELFTKCVLACPESVKFGYKLDDSGHKNLYGYLGKEGNALAVNISTLLKKADFSHISLSETDSKAYLQHFEKNYVSYDPYQYNSNYNINKTCPIFTLAEKMSIQHYTGAGYLSVNNFMYKNGINYYSNNQLEIEGTQPALDILKMMFISSGLNKIMPDLDQAQAMSYRGEHSTTPDQIQERIDSMNTPDGFTKSPAYMSTSSDPDVANNFSQGILIKFKGLYGKSIECISNFPGEREYLLSPSKIQWTDHGEVEKYVYGERKLVHEFTAKVVNPLIQADQDPDFQHISEFKELYYHAKNNDVDTSFITQHNDTLYLSDCFIDGMDIDCILDKWVQPAVDSMVQFSDQIFDYMDLVIENLFTPVENINNHEVNYTNMAEQYSPGPEIFVPQQPIIFMPEISAII